MTGSWHLYRRGSRWRQPAHLARVVVEAGEVLAVCFVPRVVELVPQQDEPEHRSLAGLGPDVVAPAFDVQAAGEGLKARGTAQIGPALLDQTALSGIGNIYKSEVLFLCGTDPFAPPRPTAAGWWRPWCCRSARCCAAPSSRESRGPSGSTR